MHAPLSSASHVISRRAGRAAFGLTLIGGTLATVDVAWRAEAVRWPFEPAMYGSQVLLLTWILALAAGAVVAALTRSALEEHPALSWAPAGGGAATSAACPVGISAGALEAQRLEPWSLALPLAGLSLALPISLHGLMAMLLGVTARDFNGWITMSSMLVSHAHLVLAALAAAYAVALCRGEEQRSPGPGLSLAVAVAAASIPGLFLFGLPPLLTALTGAVFVPAIFGWARRTLLAEREELAAR